MSKRRILLGLVLLAGAVSMLTSCEWLAALFADPPTAILEADPTSGDAPLEVTFDLSGSTAPGGVHRYRLDFGDGTDFDAGATLDEPIVHTYATAGTYTAVLELTDDGGRSDHDTAAIVVAEGTEPGAAGPIAVLGADTTIGDAPLVVSFDVSLSSAPGSALASYRIDFGDGTQPVVGTNFSQPIIHLYAEVGLHTATLYVTDVDGAIGTATLDIVATTQGGENAPVARFTWHPNDPFIDEEVTFDAGDSTDSARAAIEPRAIVVYTWDFGDGAGAATSADTVDHTYTWPGTYTVTLTVYDNDGVAGTATHEIDVAGAIAYVTSILSGTLTEIRLPEATGPHAVRPIGDVAFGVAVAPDGAFVYALGGDYATGILTLWKLRTPGLDVAAEAELDIEAVSLAARPNSGELYATAYGPGDEVWVLSTATLAVLDTIAVQSGSSVVAFTPDGDFAYVACTDGHAVAEIATATRAVERTIAFAEAPSAIAIHPSGEYAYVTTLSDHVVVLDLDDLSTDVLDVGADPAMVAFTHDGAKAYVANAGEGTVTVIDTATHAVTDTIDLDGPFLDPPGPLDVAITPGDTVAIVPHGSVLLDFSQTVSLIDCATDAVQDTLLVGVCPAFVDAWGIGY